MHATSPPTPFFPEQSHARIAALQEQLEVPSALQP